MDETNRLNANLSSREYRVKEISLWRILFTFFAVMTIGTVSGVTFIRPIILHREFLMFLFPMATAIAAFLIVPRYTSFADALITLDERGLTKKWLNPFFLGKGSDKVISWKEIYEYKISEDSNYEYYK